MQQYFNKFSVLYENLQKLISSDPVLLEHFRIWFIQASLELCKEIKTDKNSLFFVKFILKTLILIKSLSFKSRKDDKRMNKKF